MIIFSFVETKLRKSKQRDRILAILREERNHLTAHSVYDRLTLEFASLSLGNVYRNLNILVQQGLVNRLAFGSSFDVYEAIREPHYHFICDSCGDIEDVTIPEEMHSRVEALIAERYGHHVTGKSVEFHGLCKRCRSN